MEYKFNAIEEKWQQYWEEKQVYKVSNDSSKPKYYVLDMFPYPSGAGLHVGHPLGYIASDIYARYKRLKGFNVLHPMGYDSFGLPAEQYALETGQHPAVTTEKNIATFRSQLDKIGFCFDWSREVKTSDEKYYKWTQWIFLQLFNSWYNRSTQKAESIDTLIKKFEAEGFVNGQLSTNNFTSPQWKAFTEKQQADILMDHRLAFCGFGEVNWCEALGTVLANDEVVNGVSERGGYPVVKKKLRQWYLRITEYADRLLEGLQAVDFSDAMKEMQTNWIGKSYGAEITFEIKKAPSQPSPKGKESQASAQGYATARSSTYGLLKDMAKENRNNPTPEENVLWQRLRDHQTEFHIRRQHIVDQYIVDFVCLDKKLVIEVDGGYHDTEEQKIYDKARTQFLNELGFEEIRFSNEAVRNNIDNVVEEIKQKLNSKPSVGQVSPSGGDLEGASFTVYTTRPDTIFGVDFMVVAPELEWIHDVKSAAQSTAVDEYIAYVKSRSDRERQAEKKISGCFTGAYAINPFNGKEIPIWISEYVLAGYGTGAIMAVPCGDERDYKFAQHFNIPITNIIGEHFNGTDANATKDAVLENSDFLNGVVMRDAMDIVLKKIEEMGIGKRKVNYRMRDAAFSRQRYWGEPFPIKWENGIAYPLSESELPLELPKVEKYGPGPDGEGPLANLPEWKAKHLETNTMPGYAGSSWYFLRYMDPHNDNTFCDRKVSDYWNQVDLYIGGTEHAVGHLLYSRLWTKVLFDLGHIGFDEPFKRLVNQGMITGSSRFVYRLESISEPVSDNKLIFISKNIRDAIRSNDSFENKKAMKSVAESFLIKDEVNFWKSVRISELHVDVNIVDGFELDRDAFKKWKNGEYANAEFILEDGKYICGVETEKMSKRYFNTVNPNDLCDRYGADTFRMYEMFLGPVEQSKPWDTKGIEGVHRFLRKLWRLFFDDVKGKVWTTDKATDAELKVLHKTIKKIEEDTERFSFNTAVSTFMICVNELSDLKCNKKEVLESMLILLTPYAPHIAEELWNQLGNSGSVLDAAYPIFDAKYLIETSKEYPVSINGKHRATINIAMDAVQDEVEKIILANDIVQKWLEGKSPKKIIFVKGKMVNVVI
jgi:leucyl-tRNA synthetase